MERSEGPCNSVELSKYFFHFEEIADAVALLHDDVIKLTGMFTYQSQLWTENQLIVRVLSCIRSMHSVSVDIY